MTTHDLSVDHTDIALDLLDSGPMQLRHLVSELGKYDPHVSETVVSDLIWRTGFLVGRPDGSVVRLLDVLDGQVFTERVTQSTAGRLDVWAGLSLMPLRRWALRKPIPLRGGGEVTMAEFGHDALLGSRPWLPDVAAGSLLAFRVTKGELVVEALPDGIEVSPEHELRVREVVARHIKIEDYFGDGDDMIKREVELLRALSHALLEVPDLLSAPISPLKELLEGLTSDYSRENDLDDQAAWNAGDVCSFGIAGMPEGLRIELERRSRRYGMSVDRFAVLALGHLCWRTPFAEDLGPWEDWAVPEDAPGTAPRALRLMSGINTSDL